jgi:hypothetical protein
MTRAIGVEEMRSPTGWVFLGDNAELFPEKGRESSVNFL